MAPTDRPGSSESAGSPEPSAPSSSADPTVLVAGETVLDFLPDSPGPLAAVESFTRRPGGAPANVAVGLARLGRVPWFWTRVGADPFGEFLAGTLAEAGLPDRFVARDAEARTTLAFVAHDADGERSFTFYREGAADTRLQPERVPDATLEAVEWVVAGGVTLAGGRSRRATLDLVARAADRSTVVFDPNFRPELWESAAAFARVVGGTLDSVDVLKATPRELRALGVEGETPGSLARAACERGPHTVLVTLGVSGSVAVATDDAPWGAATARHPGHAVETVDTTGAGDAFLAGAVCALAAGRTDLGAVLAFADAVAALATTASGAMAALPDREAVAAFLS